MYFFISAVDSSNSWHGQFKIYFVLPDCSVVLNQGCAHIGWATNITKLCIVLFLVIIEPYEKILQTLEKIDCPILLMFCKTTKYQLYIVYNQ